MVTLEKSKTTKKKSLKKFLIPFDTIIKLISNKDMEEDTLYKLKTFRFENYYSKKGLLNLKDYNKYKDNYNLNIINTDKIM